MTFVLTVDQRASRRAEDAVPELVARAASHPDVVRPFERTAGDEVQGVIGTAAAVVALVGDLLRDGRWWVGVGAGPVEEPLPPSTRAGRGPAFVHARDAVERAKRSVQPVCVSASDAQEASDAEAALWLLAALLERRTAPGWEAVDARTAHGTQREAAASLGVTPQAVSQRLGVAGWTEERRGRTLAAHLLERCDDPATPEGPAR